MIKSFFITFEGGEGAGKSIQVEILVSHLHEEGKDVVVTREPGGTRIGEQIRNITHDPENVDLDPVTEAYLMAASRAQHVREIIVPALNAGKIVVCDRYLDSSLAYQGYGRKLGFDIISDVNKFAVNNAIPDLTILLNVPPEVGVSRRRKGAKIKDRLDLQQKDFYDRVYQGYLDLAKKFSNRYVVINATKSIEEVAFDIWTEVKNRLTTTDGEAKS